MEQEPMEVDLADFDFKDFFFSISGSVLCLFPLAIFMQMLKPGLSFQQERLGGYVFAAVMAVVPLLLIFPTSLFVLPGPAPAPQFSPLAPQFSLPLVPCAAAGCVIGATMAVAAHSARGALLQRRLERKSLSHCELIAQDTKASQWHRVSLFLKDWLDDETGLLQFVNEMPRGSLRKFELQTSSANNEIQEDSLGSARLQTFGVCVPFNYGCFPQTYRDPLDRDELHHAPGDNDPLDVIDVSGRVLEVGQVVPCRVLGAVCLIDEGQADWKIFVNAQLEGVESTLQSMSDVERLWPGRTMEILSWMDAFKEHQNTGATELHYEVHKADVAMAIIRKDHLAWKQLVKEVDENGFARGHWICTPPCERGPILQNEAIESC